MSLKSSSIFQFAAASDIGRVRTHNEDAWAISRDFGLAVVADGMGGYKAGEVASGIATSLLMEAIEERFRRDRSLLKLPAARMMQLLADDICHASASIFAAARLEPECRGMGTTLVLALLRARDMIVAHVGDSRAYCLRQGRLHALTRDHSLLQQQVDAGLLTSEQARNSRQKNLLTRGMGVDVEVKPDLRAHAIYPGDLFLLCSDGLTDELSDELIHELLLHGRDDLETCCHDLVTAANALGGGDNITVLLARAPGSSSGGQWKNWKDKIGRIMSSGS
jgi:serine/threonine protein phosphatase PrpC